MNRAGARLPLAAAAAALWLAPGAAPAQEAHPAGGDSAAAATTAAVPPAPPAGEDRLSLRVVPHLRVEWAGTPADGVGARGSTVVAGVDAVVRARGLTLELAGNPDFSDTEIDLQPVFLTRFPPFPPENRAFFRERAAEFAFASRAGDYLFASRTLGMDPIGRPLPVLGAVRLAGDVGGWSVGLLGVRSEEEDGSAHASVVRLRRRLSGTGSFAGGMLTRRWGPDGGEGTAWGVDGALGVRGAATLYASAAASGFKPAPARSSYRVAWERRAARGLSYTAEWTRVGAEFRPPVGLVLRPGITGWSATVEHASADRTETERRAWLAVDAVRADTRRVWESGSLAAGWRRGRAGGAAAGASLAVRHEDVAVPYRLSRAAGVPPGPYRFAEAELSARWPAGAEAEVAATLLGGGFFDGYRLTASVQPAWRPSSRVELRADVEANRVWFPERGQRFRGDALRLWLRAGAGRRTSLHGFVQVSGAHRGAAANLRLTHAPRAGHRVHVAYTHGRSYASPLDGRPWPWSRPALVARYSVALP